MMEITFEINSDVRLNIGLAFDKISSYVAKRLLFMSSTLTRLDSTVTILSREL